MRLSSFKTEYSFNKWFKKNWKKFAFTRFNYGIAEDPVEICRLTDGNKTVGLVVYNQFDRDNMYIVTFEIQEKYRGKGYGKAMLDLLLKETKPKYVSLDFCIDDGGNSLRFWRSMGFHRKRLYGINTESEMYRKIKKNEL